MKHDTGKQEIENEMARKQKQEEESFRFLHHLLLQYLTNHLILVMLLCTHLIFNHIVIVNNQLVLLDRAA